MSWPDWIHSWNCYYGYHFYFYLCTPSKMSCIILLYALYQAFLAAQMVKNLPKMQETQGPSLGWNYPLEKEWLATPVFLPGKFHGQRSLEGYCPWGHKELDTIEWLTQLQLCLIPWYAVSALLIKDTIPVRQPFLASELQDLFKSSQSMIWQESWWSNKIGKL